MKDEMMAKIMDEVMKKMGGTEAPAQSMACEAPKGINEDLCGWTTLHFKTPTPLFAGVDEGAYVYFVHTYCAMVELERDVYAVTDYGGPVSAAVGL